MENGEYLEWKMGEVENAEVKNEGSSKVITGCWKQPPFVSSQTAQEIGRAHV